MIIITIFCKWLYSCIRSLDRTLTGITNLGQSGHRSNTYGRVLYIPHYQMQPRVIPGHSLVMVVVVVGSLTSLLRCSWRILQPPSPVEGDTIIFMFSSLTIAPSEAHWKQNVVQHQEINVRLPVKIKFSI